MTRPTTNALKSEELKRAIDDAAKRKPQRLTDLLLRFSGLPGPKPNLTLAEAVGEAVAKLPLAQAKMILAPLAADVSAPDSAGPFLCIVAAWGHAALIRGRTNEAASWLALAELAADERMPVRVGTTEALANLAARDPRGGDLLVNAIREFAKIEDREIRWGSIATTLDAITERALGNVKDRAALLEVASEWLGEMVDARRAAERSESRRRGFLTVTQASCVFVREIHGEPDGAAWLEMECGRAFHPDARRAFQSAIDRLARHGSSERASVLDAISKALATSAKPERDPTAIRWGTRRRGER